MSPDPDPDGTDAEPDDSGAPVADDPVMVGGEPLPTMGTGSLAPILPRALARLTDVVLSLLVPGTLLALAFGETTVNAEGQDITTFPTWAPFVSLVILALYEIGLVAWRGQTVGMMIGRLAVIREDDGLPPTQRDATRRAAIPIVCIALGFVIPVFQIAYLGVYLSPILDQRTRKGWHERMAGTLVVRTR